MGENKKNYRKKKFASLIKRFSQTFFRGMTFDDAVWILNTLKASH